MLKEYLERTDKTEIKYYNKIFNKKLYKIGLIKGELNRRKRYGIKR
jgi:hypothetical protein